MADVGVNNVDSDQLALAQQAMANPVTNGTVVEVGSPVQPEIRQDRPIGDMGMGYRPAGEGDPR